MMNVDMHIHGVDFIKAMNAIKHAMKSTSWFLVSTSRPGKKSSVFYVEYHSEADFAKIFPPGWIRRPVHKYADEVLLSISESNAS